MKGQLLTTEAVIDVHAVCNVLCELYRNLHIHYVILGINLVKVDLDVIDANRIDICFVQTFAMNGNEATHRGLGYSRVHIGECGHSAKLQRLGGVIVVGTSCQQHHGSEHCQTHCC